jgi:hypothetical protein
MGRKIEPEPAGACDACARTCCTLDQVGIPCYYCHAGVFMGRQWWRFARDGMGRWLATPREDIDPGELEAERARIDSGRQSQRR